ncbi:hypothetical protein E2493_00150 [Sphingomonas parva]|uniref:Uncharacterized protein n=1 Tax=Sphingomonas parva TaxID=2555898 RepID=A0A4Y8ZY14_9SPHN|nr:hypothetical protein E2493_00150 [Sphingomonas parva]
MAPLVIETGSAFGWIAVYLLFFSPLLLLVAAIAGLFAWRRYNRTRLAIALIFFLPAVVVLAGTLSL